MKKYISVTFLIVVLASLCLSSGKRPFPKKLLGYYYGTQESYAVTQGDTTFQVPISQISVKLSYHELLIQTPQRAIKARYELTAPTKKYYALKVYTEDGIIEEWQLTKRPRKLTRKAHSPRPSTIFLKGN